MELSEESLVGMTTSPRFEDAVSCDTARWGRRTDESENRRTEYIASNEASTGGYGKALLLLVEMLLSLVELVLARNATTMLECDQVRNITSSKRNTIQNEQDLQIEQRQQMRRI